MAYQPKSVQELLGGGDTWVSQFTQALKAFTTTTNAINMAQWHKEDKLRKAETYTLNRIRGVGLNAKENQNSRIEFNKDLDMLRRIGKLPHNASTPMVDEEFLRLSRMFMDGNIRLDYLDEYKEWYAQLSNGGNAESIIDKYIGLDGWEEIQARDANGDIIEGKTDKVSSFRAELTRDFQKIFDVRKTLNKNGWIDSTTEKSLLEHERYLRAIDILGGDIEGIPLTQRDTIKRMFKEAVASPTANVDLRTEYKTIVDSVTLFENKIGNYDLEIASHMNARMLYEEGGAKSSENTDKQNQDWIDFHNRAIDLLEKGRVDAVTQHDESRERLAHDGFEIVKDWGGIDAPSKTHEIFYKATDGTQWVKIIDSEGLVISDNPVKPVVGEVTPKPVTNVTPVATTPKGDYEHYVMQSDDGTKYWEVYGQQDASGQLVEIDRQEITHADRNKLAERYGVSDGKVESWNGTDKFTVPKSTKKKKKTKGDVGWNRKATGLLHTGEEVQFADGKTLLVSLKSSPAEIEIDGVKYVKNKAGNRYVAYEESDEVVELSFWEKRKREDAQKSLRSWKSNIRQIEGNNWTAEKKAKKIAYYQAKIDRKLATLK